MFKALLTVCIMMIAVGEGSPQESDLPEELGTALGVHRIHLGIDEVPEGFRDIEYIRFMRPDGEQAKDISFIGDRRVQISGEIRLRSGRIFPFLEAYFRLTEDDRFQGICFETETIDKERFTFSGEFLKERVYNEKIGGFTRMKGVLRRYRGTEVFTLPKLPFYQYAEL